MYTKPNTCASVWWLICERPASIDRADQWHRLPRVSLFVHPTPSSCNVHVRDPLELSDWHIRFQLSNACCRKQVQPGNLKLAYRAVIHVVDLMIKRLLCLNIFLFIKDKKISLKLNYDIPTVVQLVLSFLFRHKICKRNLESSDTDFSLKIHRVWSRNSADCWKRTWSIKL